MTTGKTIALTRRTFVSKVMSLLLNMLARLVITFLPRSKRLLISWLQSPSAVILEPRKIKVTKYLPKGTDWYDFWTGKRMKGGQNVTLQTQLDRVPMFIRAGSILPLGEEMQYVGEKPWDNLEIRVYPGADATFVLYEDEGDNYNYERGLYSEITFSWDESKRTLTISPCKGRFPGMLQQRRFTILLPGQNISEGKTVEYTGLGITVNM